MFNYIQGEDAVARMFRRAELRRRYAERRRMKLVDREIRQSYRLPVPTRKELAEANERQLQMQREIAASRSPLKQGLKYFYDNFAPNFDLLFPGNGGVAGPSSPRTPTRSRRKSYATPGAFPGMDLDSDSEDTRSQAGGLDEDVVMDNTAADNVCSRPSSPRSSSIPRSSAGTEAPSSSDSHGSSTSSAKDDPSIHEYIPSKPTFVKPPKDTSCGKQRACLTGKYAQSSRFPDSPLTPRSASRSGSISNASPSTPRPGDSISAKRRRYSRTDSVCADIASGGEDAVDDDGMSDKVYSPPSTPCSGPRFGPSCSGTPSSFSTPSTSYGSAQSSRTGRSGTSSFVYPGLPDLEDLRSRPRFVHPPKGFNSNKKRARSGRADSAGIDDSPPTPRAAPHSASSFDTLSSSSSNPNAGHTSVPTSKTNRRSSRKPTKPRPASTEPASKGKRSAFSAAGRKSNEDKRARSGSEFEPRERKAKESGGVWSDEERMRRYEEIMIHRGYTKEQRDRWFAVLERARRREEEHRRRMREYYAPSHNDVDDFGWARKKKRTEEQASKAEGEAERKEREDRRQSERLRRQELASRAGSTYDDWKKSTKSARIYFQWYESGWANINSGDSSFPLRFADVPWPICPFPKSVEEVTTARIISFIQETHVKEGLGIRVAAKRELLNWHPDKFATRVLGRVTDDSEREVVKNTADVVQKTLTELVRNPKGSSS